MVAADVGLEWHNCGSLISTEIDGEELLCGACDADDGCDGHDDVIRGDRDSYELNMEVTEEGETLSKHF